MVARMPAIVSEPDRASPGFSGTLTVTVPLPDPVAPLAIVRKALGALAVQLHPAPAVTGTDKTAASGPMPTDFSVSGIEKEHAGVGFAGDVLEHVVRGPQRATSSTGRNRRRIRRREL